MRGAKAFYKEDMIVRILTYLILTLAAAFVLYPFYLIVATSLKTESEVYLTAVSGIIKSFHFENYSKIWAGAKLGRMFINSILVTSVSLVGINFVVTAAAFPLSRLKFKGKRFFYLTFFTGIFIPFQLSMIPLMKIIKAMGLFNTHAALDLLFINAAIPFGIFLIVGYMKTIPRELDEAAIVDGCTNFGLYTKIIMPLTKPATVTLMVLQGVNIWNDFFIPNLFLTSNAKRTITVGVMSFRGLYSTTWTLLMAGVVIMIIPVVIFYIFAQKYIVSGMTAGAVKG